MLGRWPRWRALALVFVVQCAFAVLLGPVFFIPVMIEEPSVEKALRLWLEYQKGLFTFAWADGFFDGGAWVLAACVVAWAGLAVAFVSPVVGKVERAGSGRSLWASVVAAAIMGAFITAMLFAGVIEGAMAALSADQQSFEALFAEVAAWIWTGAAALWLASGFLWMFLLRRIGKSRDPMGLDRALRAVFAGTAIELVLGIPVYLMARKKYDCYCAMASFLNLVMGVTALLWLCGPWVVLLFTRAARRGWSREACAQCGYPRKTGAAVCTECGARL